MRWEECDSARSALSLQGAEHDPEKWEAVFGKDHAPIIASHGTGKGSDLMQTGGFAARFGKVIFPGWRMSLAAIAAGMTVLGYTGGAHDPDAQAERLVAVGAKQTFDHMRKLPMLVDVWSKAWPSASAR